MHETNLHLSLTSSMVDKIMRRRRGGVCENEHSPDARGNSGTSHPRSFNLTLKGQHMELIFSLSFRSVCDSMHNNVILKRINQKSSTRDVLTCVYCPHQGRTGKLGSYACMGSSVFEIDVRVKIS